MRDERNPNLPAQAAGIPLSAVLVLRNIARNASKAEVTDVTEVAEVADVAGGEADGQTTKKENAASSSGQTETGGWNERLFRPMLPRLYEIMAENRALASYITSLFQLIGEEW